MSSRNSEDYGKRYLARAEELRAIARTIKDQFARDMLLETANEYQRMAAALPWSRNRKPSLVDDYILDVLA